jgi:hypothetical protein
MLQHDDGNEDDEFIYKYYIGKLDEQENNENYDENENENHKNYDLESSLKTFIEKSNKIRIEIDEEQKFCVRNQELKTNFISKNEALHKGKSQKKLNVLGRKTKNSNEKGKHTKYSEDNIIRKIKACVLNIVYIFLNNILYKMYRGDLGKGIFKKEFKKLNQKQIINGKDNKKFLYRTLKDIFSEDISTKFSCYRNDHNKRLIEFLLNENNYEIRTKFNRIFSLTFFDLLRHLRNDINIPELEGIGSLNELYEKFEDDEDYSSLIHYYIVNFEKTIMMKKNRNRSKHK